MSDELLPVLRETPSRRLPLPPKAASPDRAEPRSRMRTGGGSLGLGCGCSSCSMKARRSTGFR